MSTYVEFMDLMISVSFCVFSLSCLNCSTNIDYSFLMVSMLYKSISENLYFEFFSVTLLYMYVFHNVFTLPITVCFYSLDISTCTILFSLSVITYLIHFSNNNSDNDSINMLVNEFSSMSPL